MHIWCWGDCKASTCISFMLQMFITQLPASMVYTKSWGTCTDIPNWCFIIILTFPLVALTSSSAFAKVCLLAEASAMVWHTTCLMLQSIVPFLTNNQVHKTNINSLCSFYHLLAVTYIWSAQSIFTETCMQLPSHCSRVCTLHSPWIAGE